MMLDVCHAGQGWVQCEICTLEGERGEIGDTGVRTAVTVRYGAWEQSGESGDWSPDSGEKREGSWRQTAQGQWTQVTIGGEGEEEGRGDEPGCSVCRSRRTRRRADTNPDVNVSAN